MPILSLLLLTSLSVVLAVPSSSSARVFARPMLRPERRLSMTLRAQSTSLFSQAIKGDPTTTPSLLSRSHSSKLPLQSSSNTRSRLSRTQRLLRLSSRSLATSSQLTELTLTWSFWTSVHKHLTVLVLRLFWSKSTLLATRTLFPVTSQLLPHVVSVSVPQP